MKRWKDEIKKPCSQDEKMKRWKDEIKKTVFTRWKDEKMKLRGRVDIFHNEIEDSDHHLMWNSRLRPPLIWINSNSGHQTTT